MFAYLTNKASRQPYPIGWVSIFNGIIIYDRPLTANEINANMFTEVPTALESAEVAELYQRLSDFQQTPLSKILGGIVND
ncbi:hypothetical protein EG103P3_00011 [Enterococcus phage EG103P3]|nr:hypothetical protein EG103P3_00011 [Enterococcus phage EG103P3]